MGAASDLNREGTAPLTSEERRKARYQRRKAKREAKALETTGKTFDEVINFGNMVEAGRKCCDGSRWKTSTILFETHLLPECADIVETLAGEKRRFKGFHSFTTVEHGKARQIDALPIQERAGQKCLCQNYLTKAFSRSFISTNSASLEELRDLDRCNHLLAADLGLTLNDKKCTITPFKHHSFTFLKVRFTLQESGKVTMKLSRQSIKAIRRKMDIFRAWVTEGQMDAEDAIQSYQSWRAHAKRCDSYRTLEAMDARFTSMFAPELRRRKNKFPCTLRARKTKAGWEYTRITQQATQAA